MHPYPTRTEAVRQCCAQTNKLFKTPAHLKAIEMLQEKLSVPK